MLYIILIQTYVSSVVGTFMCSVKWIYLIVVFILSIRLALVYFQARYVYVERDDTFQSETVIYYSHAYDSLLPQNVMQRYTYYELVCQWRIGKL